MTGSEIVFYFLATIAVLMAAGVVFARNPIHSAFFLVISFLNVAGIYALLGAEFLAGRADATGGIAHGTRSTVPIDQVARDATESGG